MPGNAHEQLILFIKEHPQMLCAILAMVPAGRSARVGRRARRVRLPKLTDSTVRTIKPSEYHPDLMFADGKRGYWVGFEAQRDVDKAKETSWPAMITLNNHQRKCSGDLIVFTHSRAVAKWARSLANAPDRKSVV